MYSSAIKLMAAAWAALIREAKPAVAAVLEKLGIAAFGKEAFSAAQAATVGGHGPLGVYGDEVGAGKMSDELDDEE